MVAEMSLLDELKDPQVWEDFRRYKTSHGQFTRRELRELDGFIARQRYLMTDTEAFDFPKKIMISKMGADRKRTVYSYGTDETWMLKLLAFLLYRYDMNIPDSCYAFRRNRTAKTAFDQIRQIQSLDKKYVLKADIHDYFNSMDVDLLMEKIQKIIDDDPQTVGFMEMLLRQDRCIWENNVISEKRGGMAGVPLSSFWANIYLTDIDRFFEAKGIPYFRYSDDILIFTDSEDEALSCLDELREAVKEKKLCLNEKKTLLYQPGQRWEFLGFSYGNGTVDLSEGAIEKMKGRIRRKARKLWMRRSREAMDYDTAARSLIRSLDCKLYDLTGRIGFTWTRFYFPLLDTSEGLHEIDIYMERYLRYLSTGQHNKKNYRITYEHLKNLGYTPLVSEFYRWKEENRILDEMNKQA